MGRKFGPCAAANTEIRDAFSDSFHRPPAKLPLTARADIVSVRDGNRLGRLQRRLQAAVCLSQALGAPVRHRAVPADVARRDGRARLGCLRHRAGHRRRLCRPSELRHGDHRPAARGAGLPGRHHRAAGLAERRAVRGAGQPLPVLRRHRRQHGLHGQPLHGGPPAAPRRQLHAGRRRRPAARPLASSSMPSAAARRSATCRSCSAASRLAAPHRPLRLLVRQGAPLDPGRRQGRYPALRQCRARRRRSGASARRGAESAADLDDIRGIALFSRGARRLDRGRTPTISTPPTKAPAITAATPSIRLPAFEQVEQDREAYARASRVLHRESNPGNARAAGPAPRRPRPVADAAADPADHAGDGRRLRPALCPRAASRPMATPRSRPGT